MRILVFGTTGQVARALAAEAAARGIGLEALSRAQADLAEPEACAARVADAKVDAVINAAAWTGVDAAEAAEPEALRINAEAPGAMARAAAARGLPFLHVSTDYVFDGSGTRPWREDDPPAPLGAYGRTKLAGERAVAAAGGPHAILRTAWVFSEHGQNFVKTMLRLGASRPRLQVVDDQRGGPTPASAIAAALLTIAEAFHAGRGASGVFHFCGAPAVSWAAFAREILGLAGLPAEVAPIPSSAWPTAAPRPLNSTLDCRKINAVYGLSQPDWRPALKRVVAQLTTSERER